MKTNWLCDKFWCRLIHLKIILWNKPLEIGLCNKAQLIPQLDLSFSVVSFYLVPYQLPFYQCNCATWIHFAKHLGVVKYSSHPCYSGTGKIPKIIILYVLQASPVLLFLA